MTEVKRANINFHVIEADFYDEIHDEIFNPIEQNRLDKLFPKLIKRCKKGRCLDMGCGTGNLTLKELNFFSSVVGVDISVEMLLKCKAKTLNQPGIFLVRADSDNLPFIDNSFDFISMYSVLHHLPHPLSSLKEIFRVLREEGLIYVDHEPNSSVRLWNIIDDIFISLTRRSKQVCSKVDVHARSGFSTGFLKMALKEIGFSDIHLTSHQLVEPLFRVFPLYLRKDLMFLRRILHGVDIWASKFPTISKMGRTMMVIAEK